MELKCSDDLKRLILDTCYPIGHIWVSMNSTNPKDIVGGTWTQITNRFFYCTNTSSKRTGGSQNHNHLSPLTWIQKSGSSSYFGVMNDFGHKLDNTADFYGSAYTTSKPTSDYSWSVLHYLTSTENHLPPYITCYAWYRTA